MDDSPRCWLHREMADEHALAIGRLLAATWPKPGKDAAYRAARLVQGAAERDEPRGSESRSFVYTDGDWVVAHAAMQPREIETQQGRLWVLGLGGVCSDPDRRGEGLGAKIVRAALAMIDQGVARYSLFQTSEEVRPFYERLGAEQVTNRIFDSTAEDPEANPFWDHVAMRYPAGPGWPAGPIDLRGPGY